MILAECILDSISPQSHRLSTVRARYPKFIHGELMTHRVFTRNASSSRAIPTSKLLEEVRSDELRAAPVWWGKNQPGMQAAEELDKISVSGYVTRWHNPASQHQAAQDTWKEAAFEASNLAERMQRIGVHKQIVNRILEPFCHINVLITATEWDNFFGLRLDKSAQPEMRALAKAIWCALNPPGYDGPKELKPGEWHLPFVSDDEHNDFKYQSRTLAPGNDEIWDFDWALKQAIRVSVARCARVSYTSFDTGKRSTVEEDLKLYDRLMGAQPLHASPAEHQATPDEPESCYDDIECRDCPRAAWKNSGEWGNFRGWRQYRKMLPGEAVAPLPEGYS